jgi:hypothetical protein
LIERGEGEFKPGYSSNKRREIKKLMELQEKGLLEVIAYPEDELVWNIVNEHAAEKDFPRDREIFLKLFTRENPSIFSLGLIYKPMGYVAASVCAFDQRVMYNMINASVTRVPKEIRTITLLLLHELLKEAHKRNLVFDCEGSMLKGVEFFYRDIGGKQTPVYDLVKSPSAVNSLIRAVKQLRGDRKK